jgi:hypothetical protein
MPEQAASSRTHVAVSPHKERLAARMHALIQRATVEERSKNEGDGTEAEPAGERRRRHDRLNWKNTELSDRARYCAADWTAPFASRFEWGIANS